MGRKSNGLNTANRTWIQWKPLPQYGWVTARNGRETSNGPISSLNISPNIGAPTGASSFMSVRGEWVRYKNCDVLWLPPNRRPGLYAFQDQTLVLGNGQRWSPRKEEEARFGHGCRSQPSSGDLYHTIFRTVASTSCSPLLALLVQLLLLIPISIPRIH